MSKRVNGQWLRDGPISEPEYGSALIKVVHLLKHGVEAQRAGISLVRMINDELQEGRLDPVWRVRARRSYCVTHGYPPWQTVAGLQQELIEAFRASAVVNVVKETGWHTTPDRVLLEKLPRFASHVKKQLEELEPNLVIWCGWTTFDGVMRRLWGDEISTLQHTRYLRRGSTLFIRAHHPSYMTRYHGLAEEDEYEQFRLGMKTLASSLH